MLEKVGANFTVDTEDAFVLRYRTQSGSVYHKVPGYRFIYRTDTGQVLGRCRSRWKPLQNKDAFERFQTLIDEGQVTPANAGILGSKVWMLVKINRPPLVIRRNDKIEKYALIVNGHDGGTALTVAYTPIRVFCANMLPSLKRAGKINLTRVCHQTKMKEKIVAALDQADAEFSKLEAQLCTMATKKCHFYTYMEKVFSVTIDEKLPTRTRNNIEKIKEFYDKERFVYGSEGTFYDAYNAFTQYLNFVKGRSENTRLNSLWFGPNAKQSKKAFDIALEQATQL